VAEHLDLVKNEWLASMQIRLATVVRADGEVSLVNVTPGWEDLLNRPIPSASGSVGYPGKEPDRALEMLTDFYQSEYVFATAPHDESNCPFRWGSVVAMKPVTPEVK
jgi:hypothetical protein